MNTLSPWAHKRLFRFISFRIQMSSHFSQIKLKSFLFRGHCHNFHTRLCTLVNFALRHNRRTFTRASLVSSQHQVKMNLPTKHPEANLYIYLFNVFAVAVVDYDDDVSFSIHLFYLLFVMFAWFYNAF